MNLGEDLISYDSTDVAREKTVILAVLHKLNQVCKEKVKIALKISKIKAASTYFYESKKNHFYTVTNTLCKMVNLFFAFPCGNCLY